MTVQNVKVCMQTGYLSSAQFSYRFSEKHRVCGTGGYAPTSASLLVVMPEVCDSTAAGPSRRVSMRSTAWPDVSSSG